MLKSVADSVHKAGWLTEKDIEPLETIELQEAEKLFVQQGQRPLIVAFFGGTGVGKSSLLNRFAGEAVARVGIQRPTSHEVTLYLHKEYQLGQLPAELPTDETKISYHGDDRRRLIAWLDMPDIDSVEQRHRQLVQSWLPYIDWLVYVVSPERYHDDIGWQFLKQRGNRHSWLFVINHWDQGAPQQVDDFRARLQQEGFASPVILRTSCLPNAVNDDFSQLEQHINDAIERYGLEILQQFGVSARQHELISISQALIARLQGYDMAASLKQWNQVLTQRLQAIESEMLLNSKALTSVIPDVNRSFSLWPKRSGENDQQQLPAPGKIMDEIWSDRINNRLQDLVTGLENLLSQRELPLQPFVIRLHELAATSRTEIGQVIEAAAIKALAAPGTILQRVMHRVMSNLSWILPLLAAGWAVLHVVVRFYAGTQGEQEFLGFNFAIHTVLLISLSWLIPRFLQKKLEPSMNQALQYGLKNGIAQGLSETEARAKRLFEECREELQSHITTLISTRETLEKSAIISLEMDGADTVKELKQAEG